MKTRAFLALGLLVGLSACKEADSVVLVNVSINTDVSPVYSLRVTMSSAQTHDLKLYPAQQATAAIPSSASLVIVLPRSRAGRLDLAVDGVDNTGKNVAHGTTQTVIVVGGSVTTSAVLAAGSALCGNGIVDPGETCDDGNLYSFDGCDFRCQAEGLRPDAAVLDSAISDVGGAVAPPEVPPDMARAEGAADSIVRPDLPGDALSAGFDLGLDQAQDFGGDVPQVKNDTPSASKDGSPEATANLLDAPYDAEMGTDASSPLPDAPLIPLDSSTGLSLGQACTANGQCENGNCVDGVCCQGPCASVCMVCNLPTALGQCSMVPAGADPRDSCPQDLASTCGRDGTCDGAGGCRRWATGTGCAAAACNAGLASAVRTCDGAGNCSSAVTTPCAPFICKGGTCGTTCSTSSDCASGAFCQGSVCKPKLSTGTSCTSGDQCQSTYCTDGVCCGVASCTTPGNTCSTCSNSTNGVPNGQCGARCPICNCTSGNCTC